MVGVKNNAEVAPKVPDIKQFELQEREEHSAKVMSYYFYWTYSPSVDQLNHDTDCTIRQLVSSNFVQG
jgi:hypothetical protein